MVESSSGNLGLALSLVCAIKGYEFICVTDPNATHTAIKGIELYGGKLIIVEDRDNVGGYLGTRLQKIDQILQSDPNALWLNQYANPANKMFTQIKQPDEIIQEFERVDWAFVGSGTTGTLGASPSGSMASFPILRSSPLNRSDLLHLAGLQASEIFRASARVSGQSSPILPTRPHSFHCRGKNGRGLPVVRPGPSLARRRQHRIGAGRGAAVRPRVSRR
jgi:hypothetical protein